MGVWLGYVLWESIKYTSLLLDLLFRVVVNVHSMCDLFQRETTRSKREAGHTDYMCNLVSYNSGTSSNLILVCFIVWIVSHARHDALKPYIS